MIRATVDGVTREFDIDRYQGQDYDGHYQALTCVMIEDTVEVYLIPFSSPNTFDGYRRALWENLRDYLEFVGKPWRRTHTIFRHTYFDMVNDKLKR